MEKNTKPEIDWELEAARNKWERILEGLPEKDDPFTGESSFRNGAETTLVNPIFPSSTDMQVSSYDGFPTTPFKVLIGSEEIWITEVSGHFWNCMRGVGQSIVTSHQAGDKVVCLREEGQYVYKHPGD